MRFIYADPGLKTKIGHHANFCRIIVTELRRRGIEPLVLASERVIPELQTELGCKPFFVAQTYPKDPDALCGWLKAFNVHFDLMWRDLARVESIGARDVVYVSSAQPPQLLGTTLWLNDLPKADRPQVVLEFGTEPGVDVVQEANGISMRARDTRVDARGVLNRFASTFITDDVAANLHLVTFDVNTSAVFSAVVNRPVGLLPQPYQNSRPTRKRGAGEERTVSVLGHQRVDKGYQLVPEIAQILLREHAELRLYLHNSNPGEMAEAQEFVRQMLPKYKRLVVDQRVVTAEQWEELLDQSDLILCPYDPRFYLIGPSGLAAQAICFGVPFVAPANSTMSKMMSDYGAGGAAFGAFDAESIARTVGKVLERFDEHAERSVTAAEKWKLKNGPEKTVDAILAYAGQTQQSS
jgi:hypothetical protein